MSLDFTLVHVHDHKVHLKVQTITNLLQVVEGGDIFSNWQGEFPLDEFISEWNRAITVASARLRPYWWKIQQKINI